MSVDGARPEVELARRFGMQYVHLPIGYNGINNEAARRIVRAAQVLPKPLYIHCHHGRHRGPAAAALVCMSLNGWSCEQGLTWLEQAKTSPKFRGLYATVQDFVPPRPRELEQLPRMFPSITQVPPLAEAMVTLDRHWERLRAIKRAGFTTSADHRDLDGPHEALMLSETFRELARTTEAKQNGDEYLRLLAEAQSAADALRDALMREGGVRSSPVAAEQAFNRLRRACTLCHTQFRDNLP